MALSNEFLKLWRDWAREREKTRISIVEPSYLKISKEKISLAYVQEGRVKESLTLLIITRQRLIVLPSQFRPLCKLIL